MALFITFEGGEGCGKSTQARNLYRKLDKITIPAILIREPGNTPLGERVRYLLKQASEISISPLAELMLFNASRSQLVTDVIMPGLKEGKVIICDRFADSTIAYQSYGRGLDLDTVKEINRIASGGLKPDLTFLLDIPPELGLSRKNADANDRFEQEELAFHYKVRQGFLQLASEEPERWVVIDSTLSKNQIGGLVWDKVGQLLKIPTGDV
jgi:dTMP kinase